MDNAIFDTSVWIGFHMKKDQWRDPGKRIIKAFLDGKIKKVHVTDYVVVETVNFLLRKWSQQLALDSLDVFHADRVIVHHSSKMMLSKSEELFKKYPGLSLTDASLVALALELNTKNIFAFDADFDNIHGVNHLSDFEE